MFVIGASMIARSISEGEAWQNNTGALWVLGIGVVFWLPGLFSINFGTIWPLILIGIGLFMLFGGDYRPDIFNQHDDDNDHYLRDAPYSEDDEMYDDKPKYRDENHRM